MNGEMSARYRFGGASHTGVLLGLGMRQALPLVAGRVWLTVWLMAGAPLIGLVGVGAGLVVSFGRWRGVALYDVAVPALRLWWDRRRGRAVWGRHSLIAAGPGFDDDLPPALAGLELREVD